jgi:lipopolysaccharide export system protein LptA
VKRHNSRRDVFAAAVFAAMMVFATAGAAAQGPPTGFEGFSRNKGEPVKIQSASLEVRDKEKIATFRGDVHVTQGDTVIRCQTLVVYYDNDDVTGGKPAQPGPSEQQQIRKMEALGGVVLNQKDQNATGERADFDIKSNTLILIGNVVVTKGENVLKGPKLVVNMTDGVSRMEGGRVDALINRNSAAPQKGPASASREKEKEKEKSPPSRPARPK